MPLLQVQGKLDPVTTAPHAPIVIAIAGLAAGPLHTGGFVSGKSWGILAAPFVDDPCNGAGPASCGWAMAVRSLKKALQGASRDANYLVLTDSIDVAALLYRWQRGHTMLPTWYSQSSPSATLRQVQRTLARMGGRIVVRHDPTPPLALEVARLLTNLGLRHLRGNLSVAELHAEGQRVVQETLRP